MGIDRRGFLRAGLATAAAGIVGCGPKPDSPSVPALTADGRLVRVPADACCRQESPKEARRGMAGRKWVMAIDLSKCDG